MGEMRKRKPKEFDLKDSSSHTLECGDGGDAKVIYLKPDEDTFIHVDLKTVKQLRKWLDKAILFLERKDG
jgi:hypothetical protein